MKVAIIGGGFYGIMASIELASNESINEVTIYEKKNGLMQGAGKYNQARLHLGFHYPRSKETIFQSKNGFLFYKKKFPNITKSINKNIYLVRDDGLVGSDEYIKIMEDNELYFKYFDITDCAFKYKYDGVGFKALQVEERYIDFLKLKNFLFKQVDNLGVNIRLKQEVRNIDSNKGNILFNNGEKEKFDFIVNCTYTDPFMGFSEEKIDLKYEFCTLLVIASNEIQNQAITIMDGDYVSIYPWFSNLHSVSSVKFTPSIKTDNLLDLQNKIKKRTIDEIEKTNLSIEEHMKYFFEFNYNPIGHFSTVKVKPKNDIEDQRLVKTFAEGKCFSVIQGKLDAVGFFLNDLSFRLSEIL